MEPFPAPFVPPVRLAGRLSTRWRFFGPATFSSAEKAASGEPTSLPEPSWAFSHGYRDRDIFILPGRLGIASPKGAEAAEALESASSTAEWASLPLYGPGSFVFRTPDRLQLTVCPRKGGWALRMVFPDEDAVSTWEGALREEMNKRSSPPAPQVLGEELAELVNASFWRKLDGVYAISGASASAAEAARKAGIENAYSEAAVVRAIHFDVLLPAAPESNVRDIFRALLDSAGAFTVAAPPPSSSARAASATTMSTASTSSSAASYRAIPSVRGADALRDLICAASSSRAVRAIFFSFRFDDDFVRAFCASRRISSGPQVDGFSVLAAVIKEIKTSERTGGAWSKNVLPALCNLIELPLSNMWEPDFAAWLQRQQSKMGQRPALDVASYDCITKEETGSFIARHFLQLSLAANNTEAVLKDLNPSMTGAQVRNPRSNPLVATLLHNACGDDSPAFFAICGRIKSQKLLDNGLFSFVATEFLTLDKAVNLLAILDVCFFPTSAGTLCDLEVASNVPNFARILMQSLLDKARGTTQAGGSLHNNDTINTLIEYAFRFEGVGLPDAPARLSHLNTLRGWMTTPNAREAEAAQNQVLHLLKSSGFLQFFADILQANERLMLPMSPSAAGAAVAGVAPGGDAKGDAGDSVDDAAPPPPALSSATSTRSHTMVQGLEDERKRVRQHLLDELFGFIVVSLSCGAEGHRGLEALFKKDGMRGAFKSWFGVAVGGARDDSGQLRGHLATFLVHHGRIDAVYKDAILSGEILSIPEHFKPEVLDLLQPLPSKLPKDRFTLLVRAAIRLSQFDRLIDRVRQVEEAHQRVQKGLRLSQITKEVVARPRSDFDGSSLTVEALSQCARYAEDASRVVRASAESIKRLDGVFNHYLRKMEPSSWPGLFKAAETIALFIKYIDRENLAKAFAAFKVRISAASPEIVSFFERVQGEFRAPFISADMISAAAGDAAIAALIQNLKDTAAAAGSRQMQLLKRLTAAWLEDRMKVVNVPMAPRNGQCITFLLAAHWIDDALEARSRDALPRCRSFIAQVGTGEGKSLIIAMIAAFCVLGLGKKVHILENNAGLRDRDYAGMKAFYEGLGISSAALRYSGSFSADTQVTYILRETIEHTYRDRIYSGSVPAFPDTILIVDEVDELIVDKDPNSGYVKPDGNKSRGFREAVDALRAQAGKPSDVSAETWTLASSSYNESLRMVEGRHYAKTSDSIVILDKHGRHTNLTDGWQRVLSYTEFGKDPTVDTTFFVQSVPHMFASYSCILGFSGSLGSPAEREFLRRTFSAEFIETPPFLDTCDGISKSLPTLVNSNVVVCDDERTQTDRIVELAASRNALVPVIVISLNATHAARMRDRLVAKLGAANVSLLLERDPVTFEEMPYSDIVDAATKKTDAGRWRVTVTDLFGGRGHDYKINDDEVDENGGLCVICSSIPESEREFVQWKGRTARSDRKGQYAVVLQREDEPLRGKDAQVNAHRIPNASNLFAPALIGTLLALRDEETGKKLEDLDVKVKAGLRLNELCDKFYKRFGAGGAWPSGEQQIRLRDFLAGGWSSKSMDEIAAFAASVGLASSAASYKATSAYSRP